MSRAQEVAQAALAWVGTPYRHQGRLRGVACDCAGLVIGVAHQLDLTDFDTADYGRVPDGRTIAALCAQHLVPVPPADLAEGHVVVMRWGSALPNHLAIVAAHPLGGLSLVHALARQRRVAQMRLDEALRAAIVSAWRFPDPA